MQILIADDHSIVLKGLKQILAEAYPYAQIDEAKDGAELIKNATQKNYDIIVSDISMPGRNGIETLQYLKEVSPKTPILILSIHPAEQYAVRTIKAGASGYLTKESAPEELVKAVQHILSGRKFITPDIAELLAESYGDTNKLGHELLSNREYEVLKLIASGKTVSDIAVILSLSVNTISTYRARILEKMNLSNNAELTKYAITNGLV